MTKLPLVLILAFLTGCTHAVPSVNNEAPVTDSSDVSKTLDKRAPKPICGQMPPVDKEKIILMLRKSGKITATMTANEQQQVLAKYLKEKRERFAKSCK